MYYVSDLRLLQGSHAAAEDSCAVLADLQEQALVAAGVCIGRRVHYQRQCCSVYDEAVLGIG